MIKAAARWASGLFAWWWQQLTPKTPTPLAPPTIAPRALSFRQMILDQLDQYFDILKRLRLEDRDAYELFSRVGVHVSQDRWKASGRELSPWWLQHRPGFGAMTLAMHKGIEEQEEREQRFRPRLAYFQKMRCSPPGVEYVYKQEVYELATYFDNLKDPVMNKYGHGVAQRFYVTIEPDNSIRLLRQEYWARIPNESTYVSNGWRINPDLVSWAKENKMEAREFASTWFRLLTSFCESGEAAMTRISVIKDGLTAVFEVDPAKTADFFRDREIVNGRKIFHSVMPHERQTGNRTTNVRMHFRGQRRFTWRGYGVTITVPGLHHAPIIDFEASAIDISQRHVVKDVRLIGMRTTGMAIRGLILRSPDMRRMRQGWRATP